MNTFLIVVLALLLADYLIETVSDVLNIRNLRAELPNEFADVFDRSEYARSLDYQRVRTRFGLFESMASTALLIAFILAGGFNIVDQYARNFGFSEIATGLVFAGLLALLKTLTSIPFSLYSTFAIEERFGFNRTTPTTFVIDLLKNTLVLAIIGGLVFSGLIAFFGNLGPYAWLYAWAAITVFMMLMQYLLPAIYLPLFNKFIPLEDGELKTAIDEYAHRQGFKLGGMYTMDGSKRSSKANAFFAGIGRFRKLVLYDTLIEKHSVEELVAVMAHEIGHFKRRHIVKQTIFSIATTGLMFYLLSVLLNNAEMFAAFGMKQTSTYASLIFALILYTPVDRLLSTMQLWLSRKFEFEADSFAAITYGRPYALISALKKLSVDSLSHLTPHKFKVALEHDHPPVLERIHALERIAPAQA
jgi:STE24 endopeptidase